MGNEDVKGYFILLDRGSNATIGKIGKRDFGNIVLPREAYGVATRKDKAFGKFVREFIEGSERFPEIVRDKVTRRVIASLQDSYVKDSNPAIDPRTNVYDFVYGVPLDMISDEESRGHASFYLANEMLGAIGLNMEDFYEGRLADRDSKRSGEIVRRADSLIARARSGSSEERKVEVIH